MAEKQALGTVYVELGLDRTQFERSQQKVLEGATTTALSVEKNWQNLGVKSDQYFQAMRNSVINSYEMIKNKSTTSAGEMERAHKAASDKIAAINKEQYGAHMSLMDTAKNHWLGITAAMAGASMIANKAFSMIDKAADLEEMTGAVDRLAAKFGTSNGALVAMIQKGGEGMIGFSTATKMAGEAMLKGFDPATLGQFAKAAKTLSDFSGEKVADVFTKLVESITTGRERAIKGLVGIMELENKYSKDQIENMTDLEKAHAKANMMFEKTAEIQKQVGDAIETTADKIEKQKVKIEDAQHVFGKMMLTAADKGTDWMANLIGGAINAGRYLLTLPDKIGAPSWSAFTPQLAASHGSSYNATQTASSHGGTAGTPAIAATVAAAQKVNDLAIVGSANWQKANEKILSSTTEVMKMYETYLGKTSNEYLALQNVIKDTTIALEDQKLKTMFERNLVYTKQVTEAELIEYNRGEIAKMKLGEKRYFEIDRMIGDLDRARAAQKLALENKFLGDVKDATLTAQADVAAIGLESWKKYNEMMVQSSVDAANTMAAAYSNAAEAAARAAGLTWYTKGDGTTGWVGGISGDQSADVGSITGLPVGPKTEQFWRPHNVNGSFAEGTNYVPRTGPYILHQGEKVVPAGSASGVTITMGNIIVQGVNDPTAIARAIAKPVAQELKRLNQYTGV